jgi:SAM-dependent methyltransferase
MTYRRRTTCRLCDSTRLTLALHYPPQPLADQYVHATKGRWDGAGKKVEYGFPEQPLYPLDLYLCDDCGCAQLLDVVSAAEIYPSYTYETGSSPALVEHFRQYAIDVLEKIRPPEKSLIVDIGSNDGTFLSYFDTYYRVLGIDPAKQIANTAERNGIRTWPTFFDQGQADLIQHRYGNASIVAANNVYANIDDLRSFTENVRNLLASDGVFIFETFYLADLIDHMVFDFIYHEHLTAFALSPLIGFFQRLGMQVFDVQRVATKGGSIRVYVQHDSGKRPVSSDVPALVEWEYLRGLHRIGIFKSYSAAISHWLQQLNFKLQSVRAQGTAVAGYGASPTSTTLIYSADISRYLDYLIDDWPGKQGTFSPGLHLPVKPPAALDADYCIILAWRYADQIMARNPQYRGTWIVPLPELRVILARSR